MPDPGFAREALGWRAELKIKDMCRDAWRWQSGNPNGYRAPDDLPQKWQIAIGYLQADHGGRTHKDEVLIPASVDLSQAARFPEMSLRPGCGIGVTSLHVPT